MPWTASIGAINVTGPDVIVRVDYTNGSRTVSQNYVNPSHLDLPSTVYNMTARLQATDDLVDVLKIGPYAVSAPVQSEPSALQNQVASVVEADEPDLTIRAKLMATLKSLLP